MKTLHFANQKFEAEQIVKSEKSIVGITNDLKIFEFRGIKEFSGFTLDAGQEFDIPQISDKERIEQLEQMINLILMGDV